MKKITSLLLVVFTAISCFFAMTSCNLNRRIYSDDEDFELYSGYWKVVKYDFAEFGEIDAEHIEDYVTLFSDAKIIDYIFFCGIHEQNTDKYLLTSFIHYFNDSSPLNEVRRIDNGIRIVEMDFFWEDDMLVTGNENLKMYFQKVESIED